MTNPSSLPPALQEFLSEWTDDTPAKRLFEEVCALLLTTPGLELEYKGRPGVSHSLRARHEAQKQRSLFVLVDVIDDDPAARWLSVCFYADLVTDPEEKGDIVPGGLMGEDACCFDIEDPDAVARAYLLARMTEAAQAASEGR